ncbi:MAG: DUF1772 domain-containing protein [Paracoccus sp. (in: a-proteobacteria)]
MKILTLATVFLSLLLSAAIFGFFYAWVCSTMWGLDQADPRIAIAAMNAMNGSVRNFVFAPAFFATPFALGAAGLLLALRGQKPPATAFGAAALSYLCFGMILTMMINVPMNEALARTSIPENIETARVIWQDYSTRWQVWNIARTIASGAAFLMAAYGLYRVDRRAL